MNLSSVDNAYNFEWTVISMIINKVSWLLSIDLEIIDPAFRCLDKRTSCEWITYLVITDFWLCCYEKDQFFWIFGDNEHRSWSKRICFTYTDFKAIFLCKRFFIEVFNRNYSIIKCRLLELIYKYLVFLNKSNFRLSHN